MLKERTESTTRYLNVRRYLIDGGERASIVQDSKVAQPGFKKIVTTAKDGATRERFVREFDEVEGYITKIEEHVAEFDGKKIVSLKLRIEDGDEVIVLELGENTRPWSQFIFKADAIDLTKPVAFRAFIGYEDKTFLVLRQDGKNVETNYPKDDMGECPAPVTNRRGELDFRGTNDWLMDRVLTIVAPEAEKLAAQRRGKSVGQSATPSGQNIAQHPQETVKVKKAASVPDDPFDDDTTPF